MGRRQLAPALGIASLVCAAMVHGCGLDITGAAVEDADGAAVAADASGTLADGGPTPSAQGDGAAMVLGDGATVPVPDGGLGAVQACAPGLICDVSTSPTVLDVAVTSAAVFWLESDGVIMTARADGTNAHAIVTGEPTPLAGIEANATHVFWTAGSKLRRAGVDGSLPVTLGELRGGCMKWRSSVQLLAANQLTGDILAIDPVTGLAGQVTVSATNPWGVAPLTAPSFAYTNYDATNGRIRTGNGNLVATNPTLLSSQAGPRCMASDGASLWWANRDAGVLVRSSLGGANAAAFVQGQSQITGVSMDATYIYWTHASGIRRRTK